MNFAVIDHLQEELFIIVDAALPNKAQNQAVRRQIVSVMSTLMNRIADGWLDDKLAASEQTKAVVLPKTPESSSTTAKDSPLTIIP